MRKVVPLRDAGRLWRWAVRLAWFAWWLVMVGMVPPTGLLASSRIRWAAFTGSRTYDWLVRLPLVLWLLILDYQSEQQVAYFLGHTPTGDAPAFYVNLLARGATVAFVTALLAFVLLRPRPARRAQGILPRLIAAAGSFLPLTLILFPPKHLSLAAGLISASCVLAGTVLSVYVVLWLGRSFSMMPEARKLVIAGPYRRFRHPLYAAEQIAVVGMFIQVASWETAALLIAHALLQIKRMDYEEATLRCAFPEYAAYAARTNRIIPGVY